MARIRMLKSAAGPAWSFSEGKTYDDVNDDTALALAEAGAAVLLDTPPVVERAVLSAPENATAPAQQPPKRRGR